MAFADDFLDLMTSEIIVSQVIGKDTYGATIWGSPNTYAGRIVYKTHNVIGPQGQLVTANGIIWLDTTDPISLNDQVLMPDGSTPILLQVNQPTDETGGIAYTRIDFQ
jgi:hypothetical protein